MKLTVFQSDKGDCLLLTAGSGNSEKYVLIDGGMRGSYNQHAAKYLSKNVPRLDLVCVTHIDQDHIAGVLQMIDDAFVWRVHDKVKAPTGKKEPKVPRPPAVTEMWHNSFEAQLGKDAQVIADVLAETGNIISAVPELEDQAQEQAELATSIPEAIRLWHRIGKDQLDIPVNRRKRLLVAKKGRPPIQIGPMRFTIIAPFVQDLKTLQAEWRDWLKNNKPKVDTLTRKSRADAQTLTASTVEEVSELMLAQAAKFGDRKAITAPNLASIMALVEENGRTLLLTGDGFSGTIIDGLKRTGKLTSGGLHVNVLKVQHHGAIANIDQAFCRAITADHYIFCGNGAHTNPELGVIKIIYESRLGDDGQRSSNPEVSKRFHFWFNSHPSVTAERFRKHMNAVEKTAKELERQSKGKLKVHFLTKSHFPPLKV